MVDGLALYKSKLKTPEKVLAYTKKYREDSDVFGQFLAECFEVDMGNEAFYVTSGRLAALLDAWSNLYGHGRFGSQTVANKLTERGFETGEPYVPERKRCVRSWIGLRPIVTPEQLKAEAYSDGGNGAVSGHQAAATRDHSF
jgi:phage/plasmid-associated DNA primase